MNEENPRSSGRRPDGAPDANRQVRPGGNAVEGDFVKRKHPYLRKESEEHLSMGLTVPGKTPATKNAVVPPISNGRPGFLESKDPLDIV